MKECSLSWIVWQFFAKKEPKQYTLPLLYLPVVVYISGLLRKCWLTCRREYSQSCCACKQPVWNIVLIRKWTLILHVTGLQLKVLSVHKRTFLCLSILRESVLMNTSLPKESIQLTGANLKVRQHDCWTNALLKKDSTSSHCMTPYALPVVSCFEGLCRWNAVCRNVCWGHCPQTEGSFHHLSRTFTWASSPALLSEYYINCPDGWYQFSKWKKFASNY